MANNPRVTQWFKTIINIGLALSAKYATRYIDKSILHKTKRRDAWFLDDYTINPYSGCSFNCLYCYIRGSKYGEHMEQKLAYKENAIEILEKQLSARAKKNEYGIIVLSSATDPYLHFEEELKLTRHLLEIIAAYKFPVHIITKSDLVVRDIDVLRKINENAQLPHDLQNVLKQKVFVTFSFSTTDNATASIFEPGATPPGKRVKAIAMLLKENIHAGVSLMPLLPFISDTAENLDRMFGEFQSLGVKYIFPSTLTLFGKEKTDSKTLVMRAIKEHYPQLVEKYEKYFTTSDYMPAYYSKAFANKMNELSGQYGIPNRIPNSF